MSWLVSTNLKENTPFLAYHDYSAILSPNLDWACSPEEVAHYKIVLKKYLLRIL